jgi:hypothetical protein
MAIYNIKAHVRKYNKKFYDFFSLEAQNTWLIPNMPNCMKSKARLVALLLWLKCSG